MGPQYPIPPFANVEPLAMPLAIPSGSETWEASVRMPATSTLTERIPLNLRGPARVVMIVPKVVVVANPLIASQELAAQYWVAIDVDDRTQLTIAAQQAASAAPVNGNYVTMASFQNRLMNVWAASPQPQFGFTFQSKHPAGSFPADQILSMTLVGYYVDGEGRPLLRKVAQ